MNNEEPKTSGPIGRSKSTTLSPGLYVVATPIGNAADISLRALNILKESDRLYAEDTRVTAKLLALHGITRKLHSYREQNAGDVEEKILGELAQGQSVALVSDAGTPLLSDPGSSLIDRVIQASHAIFPVPGASALLSALVAAGLSTERFLFEGFLPAKQNERRRSLRALEHIPATLVFYEAPGRVVETLEDLLAILGNRNAAVARELTKLHETFYRAPLADLCRKFQKDLDVRGEIVIVVDRPSEVKTSALPELIDERLRTELRRHPVRDAATIVSAELGLPRRSVYARAIELKSEDEPQA